MENKRKIFTILLLIFGIGLTISPDLSAQRKGSTSKKQKKKQAKKKTNSTKTNDDSSRASTSRLNSSSSSTTTTETEIDEETEIYNLSVNLRSCIQAQCTNDIDFDKCFQPAKVETAIASNATCQTYLDNASSENVRIQAKTKLLSDINGYLKEACTSAGGYVSGTTCKFDIYYMAKAPNGKTSKQVKKTLSIGNTITCSYSNFGLGQKDMEYKEEATTEQKMAMITSGIQLGVGLLDTGLKVFDAVKTSKDLKKKNRYIHDAWYKFDGKNLTQVEECATYEYGPNGTKKEAEIESCEKGVKIEVKVDIDNEGNYYKECSLKPIESQCTSTAPTAVNNECNGDKCLCKNITSLENDKACYVLIEKATELSIKEKENELLRTIGDMSETNRQKAAQAEQKNILIKNIANQYYMNASANLAGNNQTSCSGAVRYYRGNTCPGDNNTTITINSVATAQSCARQELPGSNIECKSINYNQEFYCADTNVCIWNGSDWKNSQNLTDVNNYVTTLTTQIGNIEKTHQKILKDNTDDTSVSTYTSAVSTYQSNQDKINKEKKELEELREKSNSSISNISSSATQALLGSGMQMITTGMAINENKGMMSGACYIGSPEEGNIFLTEGEAKKLSWKSFN